MDEIEVIGNIFDNLGNIFGNSQLVKIREAREDEKQNWSKTYSDEWIPCKDKLPEEKVNPVTEDFYEYQVTYQSGDVTDIRHYKFGNGHWWNDGEVMDAYVTAWRVQIETYHQ